MFLSTTRLSNHRPEQRVLRGSGWTSEVDNTAFVSEPKFEFAKILVCLVEVLGKHVIPHERGDSTFAAYVIWC